MLSLIAPKIREDYQIEDGNLLGDISRIVRTLANIFCLFSKFIISRNVKGRLIFAIACNL